MKKRLTLQALLLLCALMGGVVSAEAQKVQTHVKWKLVSNPATLENGDVVVIVDMATANAMKNNPAEDKSPGSMKVTLKEEQDRIVSEFGDTIKWTLDRTNDKYEFDAGDKCLLNASTSLRVGWDQSESNRQFDIQENLLHLEVFKSKTEKSDYHVGLKAASGIMAMMGGSTWELMEAKKEGDVVTVNSDIAATQLVFYKKVETTKPDPTLAFQKHDYEADIQAGANSFESPVATVEAGAGAITYYSGNTDVAEVDATTGAVTLKKRGTVRIYAQIAESDNYDDYLTSYILRIDDSEGEGGRNHPFTVAEAIQYAKDGHAEEGVNYFVKGIVSNVGGAMAGMEDMADMMDMMMDMMGDMMEGMEGMLEGFMGEPGTVSYAMTDNGVNRDSLAINSGRGLELADMTSDSISAGDEVIVYGPLEYSEDNDMMSMFSGLGGGGDQETEKKMSVKMPSVNYLQAHERNLITEDIVLYYGQTKSPDDLYSISKTFGGTQIIEETMLTSSDKDVAEWVQNEAKTDSVLTAKKAGTIKVTVKAPVLLRAPETPEEKGDTIFMKRRFTVEVRNREVLAAGEMVGDYELVTTGTELQPGDKLIVVATVDDKSKVLCENSASDSNPLMALFGGGNAKDVTIGEDGKITEVPDATQILTLEQDGEKWRLQTGKSANGDMTYLYISDTDNGSGGSVPGIGGSGATLKTGCYAEIADSCQVTFAFPEEKNDSVVMKFNFSDREKDGNPVIAKNVIRYGSSVMSSSFAGYEETSEKASLPRLYRFVQADAYDFTVGAAKWATLVSAYDVELPAEFVAYVVTALDEKQVTLTKVTTSLKAGVPYLLNAPETQGTFSLTRTTNAPEPEKNLLAVSDETTTSGVYVLASLGEGAGFYKWTGGLLGAGRVYLPVNEVSAKTRAFISFNILDDATTGIANVNRESITDNQYYTLDGRRVEHPMKGVYIQNGKKVVVK